MKKIYWLNGQGIDGLGSTKFMIEFSRLFDEKHIINFDNKNAHYSNEKNFDLLGFDIITTSNYLDHLTDTNIIFINSFPNNKSTLEEVNSFYDQLEQLHNKGVIIIGFLHFNTKAYFNKCPKIFLGLNFCDYIFTFNKNSEYANMIAKFLPHKKNSIKEFALPYKFDEDFDLSVKEDICTYAGRYATFKKPIEMMELFKRFKDIKYLYCGVGRTIESFSQLIEPNKDDLNIMKKGEELLINEKVNMKGEMKNKDLMNELKRSKFAYSGFILKAENYGNRFEYAMYEMINNRCICIFNEHFLNTVVPDQDCFISMNDKNYDDVVLRMKIILHNDLLYRNILKKQIETAKKLCDPEMVIHKILSQISFKKQETLTSKELISSLISTYNTEIDQNSICIEPSDFNKKYIRVYRYEKTRLRKDETDLLRIK